MSKKCLLTDSEIKKVDLNIVEEETIDAPASFKHWLIFSGMVALCFI